MTITKFYGKPRGILVKILIAWLLFTAVQKVAHCKELRRTKSGLSTSRISTFRWKCILFNQNNASNIVNIC